MPEFRFKFDTVEVSNPINWKDIEITIQEQIEQKFFYNNFTSVLQFGGSAYSALKTAYNTGLCEVVVVDVDERCSRFESWSDLYDGEIRIKDIDWDFENCIASAEVVRKSAIDDFINNIELLIDPSGDYPATYDFRWPVFDTFQPTGGGATTSGNNAAATLVYNMLDNIISIISRDNLGFTSLFFETDYVAQVIRIDVTSPPAAGETLSVTLQDPWGITHVYQCEASASSTTTYDNFEKVLQLGNGAFPSKVRGEIAKVTRSTVGGTTERFDCTIYFEASITGSNFGSGSGSVTIQTDLEDGEKQCLYTNSDLIDLQITANLDQAYVRTASEWGLYSGVVSFTFPQVLEWLGQCFNVAYNIEETTPGTWNLRIEKKETYLNSTATITLRNLKDVIYTPNENAIAGTLQLGKKPDSEFNIAIDSTDSTGADKNKTWLEIVTDLDCYDYSDLRQDDDLYCLFGTILYEDFENNLDIDYHYINHGGTSTIGVTNGSFSFDYKFWDVSAGIFKTFEYQNVRTQPYGVLLRYNVELPQYDLPDSTYTKSYTSGGGFSYTEDGVPLTVSEGSGFYPLIAEFETYISRTDFQSVLDNPERRIVINETNDPANDRNARIIDCKYRFSDGKSFFKVACKK